MNSIADLIDKLVIENIKIFNLREKLHNDVLTDEEYVMIENKMNIINENRGIIMNYLDDKISAVMKGAPNRILRHVKTYAK